MPTGVLPRVNSIAICTAQQTAVYTLWLTRLLIMITMDMLSSLQIWPKKRLSYQNGRLYFINLRPTMVYGPSSPSYDSSNIPVYEIYSWKITYDRKIAAVIVYTGSTLGSIYSKYAIGYCGYLWFWLYMLVSDIVHARFAESHMKYIYQKWSDICIKWYLTQTTPSRVDRFKQTALISNIRQITFKSL